MLDVFTTYYLDYLSGNYDYNGANDEHLSDSPIGTGPQWLTARWAGPAFGTDRLDRRNLLQTGWPGKAVNY